MKSGLKRQFETKLFAVIIQWNRKIVKLTSLSSMIALTHWDRDKMDNIFQTTFSNPFSWMKIFEILIQFDWRLFLMVQLTIKYSIGSDNGLVPIRRQAITWTNDGLGWWRIHASLSLNELKAVVQTSMSCFVTILPFQCMKLSKSRSLIPSVIFLYKNAVCYGWFSVFTGWRIDQ